MTIKDKEFCADIGSQGATCAHLLTGAVRDIPQPEWDDMRFGWVCSSAADFAEVKKEVEQLCSVSGKCDYQTKAALSRFFDRVERLHMTAESLRPLYGY